MLVNAEAEETRSSCFPFNIILSDTACFGPCQPLSDAKFSGEVVLTRPFFFLLFYFLKVLFLFGGLFGFFTFFPPSRYIVQFPVATPSKRMMDKRVKPVAKQKKKKFFSSSAPLIFNGQFFRTNT